MFFKKMDNEMINAIEQRYVMESLREFKKEIYEKNPHLENLDYQLLVQLNDMSFLFAKENRMPEEEFMPCEVLSLIFEQRPKSLAALKRVEGLDPDVIENYGKSYINLIKRHAKLEKAIM